MTAQPKAKSQAVCQVSDLSVGEMKQFTVVGTDILLCNVNGQFFATAARCSHYGAPLETGVLHCDKAEARLVCPWHNACFGVPSGKMLAPPGRDNLTTFAVQIKDDAVYVELPDELAQQQPPEMAAYDAQLDARQFVIVGGGAGGSAAAEMLRQVGFQGNITVLTQETELPYDRTKLSKAYLQTEDGEIEKLRSQSFYQKHHIDVHPGVQITQLDTHQRQVQDSAGNVYPYDALLIATGGQARQLGVPGDDLNHVYTLRKGSDAAKIAAAAKTAKRAVIVGAGFIGMEAAASLCQRGLEVTVVAPGQVPFEKVLGTQVGQRFQQLHEKNGVTFCLEQKVIEIEGDTAVSGVKLDSGKQLPADIVIVGVGVEPATDWLKFVLDCTESGGIKVNQYLQAADAVYAAGDIASFPQRITGNPVRIEHWRLALQQGQIAACNMIGQTVPFKVVPFFWTGQFDLKLRYVGHAESWETIWIDGSLKEPSFLAFYLQDNRVAAVAGIGRDRDIAAISELMRLDAMPSSTDVQQQQFSWVDYLSSQS